MRFAIIIPYKNEFQNLRNVFSCIIKQKKKFSEVIFVDHNSTDGSHKLVNYLIGKRKGFQNLKYNGKTMFDVLNFGLRKIKNFNCYVLPGSANDGFFDNMLQIAYNDIRSCNNIGLWSAIGYYKINRKFIKFETPILSTKKKIHKGSQFLKNYLKIGNFIVGASCLYNYKFIKKEKFFIKELLGIADLDIYKKIGIKYGHFYNPKRLCYVTKHKGQFSYLTYKQQNFFKVSEKYKKSLMSYIEKKYTIKILNRLVFLKKTKFNSYTKLDLFFFKFIFFNLSFILKTIYYRKFKNIFIP